MRERTKIGFFDSLVGLCLAPGETLTYLLKAERPQYGVAILALFYITLLTPVAILKMRTGLLLYQPNALAGLLIVPTLSIVVFVLIESVFLRVFSIKIPIAKLAAAACYSLLPIILVFCGMYIINYIASGSTSYLTIVLNSFAARNESYTPIVHYIVVTGGVLTFIIFFCALKFMGDLFAMNAFLITALSLLPLFISFVVSMYAADFLISGLQETFMEMLMTPQSILNV